MSFSFHRNRRGDPAIDLTPMLDVMFNLVLFFVVTTNFAKEDAEETPGIQVDLPRAGAQTILSGEEDLNVWMTVDGAVYVNEQPVDIGGLREALRAKAAAAPQSLVVIKADEGVSHGRVVRVMDLAKEYGLSKLAIATDVDDDPAR